MVVGGAGGAVFVLLLVWSESFSIYIEEWLKSFLLFIVAAAQFVGVVVGVSLLAVWLFGWWIAFPITMVVFALLLILGLFLFLAEADVDAGEWLGHVVMFVLVFLMVVAGSWVLWLLTLGQGGPWYQGCGRGYRRDG